MKIVQETISTKTKKNIAIIISRYNNFINQHLLDGALDILKRIGQINQKNIPIIHVPGAYEIPIIASIISKQKKYNAIIALGTIIKGHTLHYSHISHAVNSGLTNISITNNIPISIGIITANNIEQAIERAGTKLGNKGSEAALTALEMINIINILAQNK
ncbi:6,7-dimethyl-8-ribityllumazine synthase [Buchnera aphidicola str. Bp (Baizongia pistaciae)]|uniref:6,7-dimethyl-8-ribityllumazine synthase n=1 Tax=Buchnera aphidicola subsp. Baizongia pistaciae (strain Bp) TaxID=224915 RepID=RISB_BUCBP|nr:6,7-dimethyl-8-ribityllumazine synthase [Buchnera aphidicola]Q89AB1.1 RecName: Full=6,7-dimethyl-8-ribityllumazine synthase; Short=DMRL synthase; Short=LS; Short=Lumazine synthase [Buchnera aphidicola str. Bp (Baizongia pistaciae)]AAO27118.1 6,7-dimethyl-8-ribityllumazine synthase [Buchnera aphidicola str. Bp (Baizongia pistaciae)]